MTIGDRLAACRAFLGLSQKEMSEKVDIAASTLKKIEKDGNVPNGETLLGYSRAGFSPTWILTGEGEMLNDAARGGVSTRPIEGVDTELLGRIVDAISRLHRDERISLPAVDLGRLSGAKYEEIASATNDPDERLTMVKLMIVQLRKELHATPVDEPRKDRA